MYKSKETIFKHSNTTNLVYVEMARYVINGVWKEDANGGLNERAGVWGNDDNNGGGDGVKNKLFAIFEHNRRFTRLISRCEVHDRVGRPSSLVSVPVFGRLRGSWLFFIGDDIVVGVVKGVVSIERVFVTWKSWESSSDVDVWLLRRVYVEV